MLLHYPCSSVRLQCTTKDSKDGRCKAKYCKPCLYNRYNEDFDKLKANTGAGMSKSEKAKHVSDESYYFEYALFYFQMLLAFAHCKFYATPDASSAKTPVIARNAGGGMG